MNNPCEILRGGLVASCQPVDGGPMDQPEIVRSMAQAAVAGGAAGVRIEGVENLRSVRPSVTVPIIGLVKHLVPEDEARITIAPEDVDNLVAAGADIIAFDATNRPRKHGRDEVLARIQQHGVHAMADCATLLEAKWAVENGVAIVGTTLSGYTPETQSKSAMPDLTLISEFAGLGRFVMAEGRFDTPDLAAAAVANGADAVTVGSVLTRLEVVSERFLSAIRSARRCSVSDTAGTGQTAQLHL